MKISSEKIFLIDQYKLENEYFYLYLTIWCGSYRHFLRHYMEINYGNRYVLHFENTSRNCKPFHIRHTMLHLKNIIKDLRKHITYLGDKRFNFQFISENFSWKKWEKILKKNYWLTNFVWMRKFELTSEFHFFRT